MAILQKEFEQFHEEIKLYRFEENATLRGKRDIVLDALRDGLQEMFEEDDEAKPTFAPFNQGSYAMDMGVKPIKDQDYDIDVGLRFHVSREEYGPLDVKGWVYDALDGHTSDVELKRPCVTVNYVGDFHVDLAVYASAEENYGTDYLSKGFRDSKEEYKNWEESDTRGFIELINDHFSDEEGQQFRRVVRYLKRWKDLKFSANGNAAPVGIGLTICAYRSFQPTFHSDFSERKPRDLRAVRRVVDYMRRNFQRRYHEEEDEYASRLCARMPVQPRDDVFDRISNRQMEKLKTKLDDLHNALDEADKEPDPHEAAKIVVSQFGEDFPVPDPDDGAKKSSRPAITTESSSA